ncbi:MAG: hypothetical protein ABIL39_07260 [candidate division WOR-3 bacterium]
MKCPFLEEIVVNYCSIATTRKMIPKGKNTELSKCESTYFDCPIYQGYLAKKKKVVKKTIQKVDQNGNEQR